MPVFIALVLLIKIQRFLKYLMQGQDIMICKKRAQLANCLNN